MQAERLAGMTIFATALHERGHLRNDVTIDDARDTLWTYNSAELYQLLVIERGPDARPLTASGSLPCSPPRRSRPNPDRKCP